MIRISRRLAALFALPVVLGLAGACGASSEPDPGASEAPPAFTIGPMALETGYVANVEYKNGSCRALLRPERRLGAAASYTPQQMRDHPAPGGEYTAYPWGTKKRCLSLNTGAEAKYVYYENRHTEYTRTETGEVFSKITKPNPTDQDYCVLGFNPDDGLGRLDYSSHSRAECDTYTKGERYSRVIRPQVPEQPQGGPRTAPTGE